MDFKIKTICDKFFLLMKADEMALLFSIMDKMEKQEEIKMSLVKKKPTFLSPVKLQESGLAHLYREVCECGKRRIIEQDDLQSLILSTKEFAPEKQENLSEKADNLFTIILLILTIVTMIFLFIVRNL